MSSCSKQNGSMHLGDITGPGGASKGNPLYGSGIKRYYNRITATEASIFNSFTLSRRNELKKYNLTDSERHIASSSRSFGNPILNLSIQRLCQKWKINASSFFAASASSVHLFLCSKTCFSMAWLIACRSGTKRIL